MVARSCHADRTRQLGSQAATVRVASERPGELTAEMLRLGTARVRRARAGDHGDREPDAGLLLRPGRHLPRRARPRARRAGGGRGRRHHRHRRGEGRSRRGGDAPRRRRGARSGFVAEVRAPLPGRRDQRRHLAARGRRGGLRGGRGSAQRRVGRGRSAARGGRRAVRRGAGVHARGRRRAADPAAPGRVRRRDGATSCG